MARSRPTADDPHCHRPRRRGRRLGAGVGAAIIAVVLLGCGGDDDVAVEDGVDAADGADEDGQDTGDAEEATVDADDLAEEEDADADAQDADEQEVAEEEESGTGQHSPPSPIDCTTVSEPSPGAVILFPDANDPASLQAGPGPVTVEVAGCSDTFEANLQYDAFHGQNSSPTLSGFTTGGTLGTWEAFSISETYWTPGDWTVVVFANEAQTGNRVEYDEVTFTVD